jgi:chromosome segregation ATPase
MNSNHLKAGEATGGREQKLEEIAELRGELAECWAAIRKYWMEFCGIGIEAGSEVTTIIEGHKFLRAELSRVSRDNEGLQNTNEALRLALSRVSAERRIFVENDTRLRAELDGAKVRISNVEGSFDKSEKELEVSRACARLEKLRADQAESELARVSGERDAAQSALCDYTDMLQNARDRAEAAESELARLKQEREGTIAILKMADVHLGWGDCSLENVHNEIRAEIKRLAPQPKDEPCVQCGKAKCGSRKDVCDNCDHENLLAPPPAQEQK